MTSNRLSARTHPTYEQLSLDAKCLIDGYLEATKSSMSSVTDSLKQRGEIVLQGHIERSASSEVRAKAQKDISNAENVAQAYHRDVILALGGIERLYVTLSNPNHPEHSIIQACKLPPHKAGLKAR